MRVLWANCHCLLDRSSGASLSAREILKAMADAGFEVHVLGATNFDDPAAARAFFGDVPHRPHSMIEFKDGLLSHQLLVTRAWNRGAMTSAEEQVWYNLYNLQLDRLQPDIVCYYGGQPLDFLIGDEARSRGIRTVFYIANGNYAGKRWARDIDLILTDTQATADRYRQALGRSPVPVGKFIDPTPILASGGSRDRVLFVNPLPEKGALWVALLAEHLLETRPDIVFEVVEARGHWSAALAMLERLRGRPIADLTNVVVTPNTLDMRPVYGRARCVLVPSLWWESGARVLAEAMLNGIPAITTDHGGARELIGAGGMLLKLADRHHLAPYDSLPDDAELGQLAQLVQILFDDLQRYLELCTAARAHGESAHSFEASSARLLAALRDTLPTPHDVDN